MSNLIELFKTHKELSEDDFKKLWESAVFIFDSNVLLDLYRLPKEAQQDLLSLLEDKIITDRVWIPFQVAIEFTYNRLTIISDQKSKFHDVTSTINTAIEKIEKLYTEITNDIKGLDLKRRHSVIDTEPYINQDLFKSPAAILNSFLENLKTLDAVQPEIGDSDKTRERISKIFQDKIGDTINQAELDSIYKEGENRYKEKIGPGYEDRDKPGAYFYQDLKLVRKYGDLIVWKQIIQKVVSEKIKFVVFITGDVKKDWWEEKRGRKIGPRYDILNEIYTAAPELEIFYMYNTSTFMRYAKEKLSLDISEASIVDANSLIQSDKEIESKSRSILTKSDRYLDQDIGEYLSSFEFLIPGLRISVVTELENFPLIPINNKDFHLLFSEIFENVMKHSSDGLAEVLIESYDGMIGIHVTNSVIGTVPLGRISHNERLNIERASRTGLMFIRDTMNRYGRVTWELSPTEFTINLIFDSRLLP
jgi:hypothetical protein